MASPAGSDRQLTRGDLLPLERYALERNEWRARAIAHKRMRKLALGGHMTLLFEDRLTIHYQVQEMLRIERIFEPAAIEAELAAYNPLIPDGRNLKATLLIEYPDASVRQFALERLRGIEDRVCAVVGDWPVVFASADEDLPRSNASKTSAVHFLRFEFSDGLVAALRAAAPFAFMVDDPRYPQRVEVVGEVRAALLRDFT
jgi:hypothetical protein